MAQCDCTGVSGLNNPRKFYQIIGVRMASVVAVLGVVLLSIGVAF